MIIPKVKVRVTNIDYAVIPHPDPLLDQCSLPRVPVIRIFGESSEGCNACVHVHQVYPYFYVDYHGSMDPEYSTHDCARFWTVLIWLCSPYIYPQTYHFFKSGACGHASPQAQTT